MKPRRPSPAAKRHRPVHTRRRTERCCPKSNYELFNCNNLNIRYWSWNYRGCWPISYRALRCGAFPTRSLAPQSKPSAIGTSSSGRPLSSGGFSTSLKPACLFLKSGRRLSVRYDGFGKDHSRRARHGIGRLFNRRPSPFQVVSPAASPIGFHSTARLADLPAKCFHSHCPTTSGVNSKKVFCRVYSPDLPSN